jgi:magnesium chelatase family protein
MKYYVLKPDWQQIRGRTLTKPVPIGAQRVVRILKVARTVADLEGAEDLDPKHPPEAVQYRTLDRNL